MLKRRFVATDALVEWYTRDHLTHAEIGEKIGRTARAVCERLASAGITSEQGEWVDVLCAFCEEPLRVTRKRWRRSRRLYCRPQHYYAARVNPAYIRSVYGTQLARAVVSQHFPLMPEYIVHHLDGNNRNNDLANLVVYISHSDHMKGHHGQAVEPIWRGADVRV